ncbi:MAG: HAMP domain-containing protein [Spirochaetia bacterium]|nr:HAMP domain-containing protein [Spirochaetia bacterium]
MKINVKLTILFLLVAFLGIAPISFIFISRSETIITEKTFEVCFNLASNLSTIAREELLLNNTYEGIEGVMTKLRTLEDDSLNSVYVINKYGIYISDLEQKRVSSKVSQEDIQYFSKIVKPNIHKAKNLQGQNMVRFEFPVFLEENDLNSLLLGFVVFEFNEQKLYRAVNQFKRDLLFFSVGMSIFIILFAYIISRLFSKNIQILSRGVEVIGSGDLSLSLEINSSDEIGDLARNFNNMTAKLREADDFKAALLNSYSKFVPVEFIDYLKKNSVLDISLGDQIEIDMSILFSDIRSFTTISEKMTAEETFKFINSYLNAMGPCVTKQNGFIDKYIGDAIMALFRTSENAVDAAINMLDELYLYNKKRVERNYEKISIGIGIHTGRLILGIVGSELRIQGTVISDAVNLASRIEGLTKLYGATLLMSEESFSLIENKNKYYTRIIDRVKVKGKDKPVDVIEILNGNSERIINLKLSTNNLMNEGITRFRERDFGKAIKHFEEILSIDPKDKAANIHLQRSIYFHNHGVPPDWEGVSALNEK